MNKTILFILVFIGNINTKAQKVEMDYGLGLNLNYPLANFQNSSFYGKGLGGIHLFVSAPVANFFKVKLKNKIINNTNYHFSLGIANVGIHNRDSDMLFTNTYIDGSASVYIKPFYETSDFKIILGIRPYLLAAKSTERFKDGEYVFYNLDTSNKNQIGNIGIGGIIGVSVALSNAVNLELKYNHNFGDIYTSTSRIEGRQSMLEITLSLSAISIRDKLFNKEIAIHEYVEKLKKGNLFVMMPTINQAEINALVNANKADKIINLLDEIHQSNLMIMNVFKTRFNFCNVYFFNDTNAYKVSNKVFGNIFFDDKFKEINTKDINTNNFFVASFCEDISNISEKIDYGLHVYDDKIIHLGKPFNTQQNQFSLFDGDKDPINVVRKRMSYLNFDDYARKVDALNFRLNKYAK